MLKEPSLDKVGVKGGLLDNILRGSTPFAQYNLKDSRILYGFKGIRGDVAPFVFPGKTIKKSTRPTLLSILKGLNRKSAYCVHRSNALQEHEVRFFLSFQINQSYSLSRSKTYKAFGVEVSEYAMQLQSRASSYINLGDGMNLEKEFELYRKLEVMSFRYFRVAEFLEICLKTNLKLKDDIGTILGSKGYRRMSFLEDNKYFKGSIHIPHNPFYNNSEDQKIWRTIYPKDFSWVTNDRKDIKEAYQEVWRRINEIKWWLGITKDTLFCGIRIESRLTTLLENFLKTGIPEFRYDFEFTIFYNIEKYTIQRYLRVMKNRSRKGKSIRLIR